MRAFLILMVACKGTTNPTGDPPTDTDVTPVPTPVELECDDGTDDDEDGDIDCFDSDCEAEVYCAWPREGIDYTVRFAYTASFEATLAGYSNCVYQATSFLARDRDLSCPGCDRVYCGDFTVTQDNCPAEFDRPDTGCYGFAFTSDSAWDVWYENTEDVTYESLGTAMESTTAIGFLELTTTENITVSGINGGSVVGDFTFFQDPQ